MINLKAPELLNIINNKPKSTENGSCPAFFVSAIEESQAGTWLGASSAEDFGFQLWDVGDYAVNKGYRPVNGSRLVTTAGESILAASTSRDADRFNCFVPVSLSTSDLGPEKGYVVLETFDLFVPEK